MIRNARKNECVSMIVSNKIESIQALRGIAVLLVVFFHMRNFEEIFAQYDFILPNFLKIGHCGVDLFFVISGFVMVSITGSSFQNKEKILQFLYHRVTRIYPLYWFYSFFVLFLSFAPPQLLNDSQLFVKSLLLLPPKAMLDVGWTLIFEVYFYAVFMLLLLFPKAKFLFGLLLWAIVIAIVNIYFNDSNNVYLKIYSHPLILEFIGGTLIGLMFYNKKISGNEYWLGLITMILWGGGYYLFILDPNLVFKGWERTLAFGIPSMFTVYTLLLFESKNKIIFPRWILKIGDASYSIYLSHVLVIFGIGSVWSSHVIEGYIDNVGVLILMTITVFSVGFLSYHLIERKILGFTRSLEKIVLPSKK